MTLHRNLGYMPINIPDMNYVLFVSYRIFKTGYDLFKLKTHFLQFHFSELWHSLSTRAIYWLHFLCLLQLHFFFNYLKNHLNPCVVSLVPFVFCFSWIFDKEDNSSCLFLGLKLPGELLNLFYVLTVFGVEFAALSYLYCVCVFLVLGLSEMSVCMLRLYTINSHHNFQLIILLKRLIC